MNDEEKQESTTDLDPGNGLRVGGLNVRSFTLADAKVMEVVEGWKLAEVDHNMVVLLVLCTSDFSKVWKWINDREAMLEAAFLFSAEHTAEDMAGALGHIADNVAEFEQLTGAYAEEGGAEGKAVATGLPPV